MIAHHTEPSPEDRVYYRRRNDGQLGYRVLATNGDQFIRLDRPNELLLEPMSGAWIQERSTNPFNDFQIAQIQFLADAQLCKYLGILVKKKLWIELTDEARIEFTNVAPAHPLRRRLYAAIKIALVPPTT